MFSNIHKILILIVLTLVSCNSSDSPIQVVIQDKFEREGMNGHWYHISYKEVKTSRLGLTHIGKYDYEHCSPGDTIYVNLQ